MFDEQLLRQALPDLHQPARFRVAFSGGLDSSVLLHALRCLLSTLADHRIQLDAIHVHHALSANADAWLAHCEAVCAALHVPLVTRRVALPERAGESLESRAREARYAAFEELLEEGDWLLLAHHRDDQAETVLYRLLRGSGPAGLAGMPRDRSLGRGRLLRPLLDVDREALEAYARRRGLRWVEDESNSDERFDRNYLRREILPRLHLRWPGFKAAWARSAALCGEGDALLDSYLARDFQQLGQRHPEQLPIPPLLAHDPVRRRYLLRYWFRRLQRLRGYPTPPGRQLQAIAEEVLEAREDASPQVAWGAGEQRVELRRYRDLLYVLGPMPAPPRTPLFWRPPAPLPLGPGFGELRLEATAGAGLRRRDLGELSIRFRQGGERLREAGRGTRPLKQILQERGVPPWERDRLPLIYAGEALVAVADLLVDADWLRDGAEDGRAQGELCRLVWLRD